MLRQNTISKQQWRAKVVMIAFQSIADAPAYRSFSKSELFRLYKHSDHLIVFVFSLKLTVNVSFIEPYTNFKKKSETLTNYCIPPMLLILHFHKMFSGRHFLLHLSCAVQCFYMEYDHHTLNNCHLNCLSQRKFSLFKII